MTTGLSIDDFELVQPRRDPMKVRSNPVGSQSDWSLAQKIALTARIVILSGLSSLSYFERSSLDVGFAYSDRRTHPKGASPKASQPNSGWNENSKRNEGNASLV